LASGQVSERTLTIDAMPKKFLQLHNSYVVTQTDDGFIIIDQHALHERIIYEDLCRKVSQGNLESQRLLMPETFEITDAQAETIKTNSQLLEKMGIELEPVRAEKRWRFSRFHRCWQR